MTEEPLRERLRNALMKARKERDTTATTALRSAIAAVDNAEAIPAEAMPAAGAIEAAPLGVGASEAARRQLSEEDIAAILRREVAEREEAAAQIDATHPERAGKLLSEAAVLAALIPEGAPRSEEIEAFWREAVRHARFDGVPGYVPGSTLAVVPPPSWSFGGTPEQADELLRLVLDGAKTATASALWDYEAEGEPVPEVGGLGIVLDSDGRPRALLATTRVDVVPFDQVTEEHARLEGEGDGSLAHWRSEHERFFGEFAAHDRGFARDMPVVCERFTVLHTA